MLPSTRALLRPASARLASSLVVKPQAAKPHAPNAVSADQSPNAPATWSAKQAPRHETMVGPRFEQTAQQFQPMPLSAMQLTAEQPIRLVTSRTATCDGGGGALGHPRVFINLDKKGPRSCGYCGIRFEMDHGHHEHH